MLAWGRAPDRDTIFQFSEVTAHHDFQGVLHYAAITCPDDQFLSVRLCSRDPASRRGSLVLHPDRLRPDPLLRLWDEEDLR